MSEETTNYGIPNTTLDTDAFPPQTGDLLGGYIARLSARVRSLETASTEPSAYQRSLEARIERLEAMMSDPEHEPICRDCGQPEHMDGCDAQPEPSTVTTPDEKRVRKSLLCDQCQSPLAHGVIGSVHWCSSGFINDGEFGCRGFVPEAPAATAPTVTRERTHGRYGTRNLTKTKPDHIVDPNKLVCATCGHAEADHIEPAGIHICLGGTLGSPCKCAAFTPVATEG